MFRAKYPIAWTFHRNTSRWPSNTQAVLEQTEPEAPFKEYFNAPLIPLPEPQPLSTPLGDTILNRFSCRRFEDAPLKLADLSTLLRLAYGIQDHLLVGDVEFLGRPVPSGGGLYALELYLLARRVEHVAPGIYHYAVLPHALEQMSAAELPQALVADLFMGQPYVADSAVVVILTTVLERSLWKYADRGYRYILFEAGHVAQNFNLIACGLGLGSLNLGGFFDAHLASLLGLDLEQEVPLYGIALGVPAQEYPNKLYEPTM
jgi:SagB-type dehydrogenase family enzyme